MKKEIKHLILFIVAGAMVMIGMRSVEYVWPKPTKITVVYYVCFGEGKTTCRKLTEKQVESLK